MTLLCSDEGNENDANPVSVPKPRRVAVHGSDNDGTWEGVSLACNGARVSSVRGIFRDRTNHHEPVSRRDVYLTMEFLASVDHLDLWEVARVHDLRKQLKSASYQCLTSDDGSQNGYNQ